MPEFFQRLEATPAFLLSLQRRLLKTLTDSLKGLELDGLVIRKEYPQVPPKVEYSLTEKGKSLIPMLTDLCNWGEEHRNKPSV